MNFDTDSRNLRAMTAMEPVLQHYAARCPSLMAERTQRPTSGFHLYCSLLCARTRCLGKSYLFRPEGIQICSFPLPPNQKNYRYGDTSNIRWERRTK